MTQIRNYELQKNANYAKLWFKVKVQVVSLYDKRNDICILAMILSQIFIIISIKWKYLGRSFSFFLWFVINFFSLKWGPLIAHIGKKNRQHFTSLVYKIFAKAIQNTILCCLCDLYSAVYIMQTIHVSSFFIIIQ